MSGLLAGKVWLSGLAPHLKPLAATLADIANDDGTSIYPTVDYVAWRLGCSVRRVQRGIDVLHQLGILQLVEEAGHYRSAEYRLLEDVLPKRERWPGLFGGKARGQGCHGVTHRKSRKGVTVSPINEFMGDTASSARVTPQTFMGDTASSARVTSQTETPPLSLNDPSLDPSIDPSIERERASLTLATPLDLVVCWNTTREPGPKVQDLTPKRSRRYQLAITAKPLRADWEHAIRWLNDQVYTNARGTGDHATWRASLDWLAKPGQLVVILEQAQTDAIARPQPLRRGSDGQRRAEYQREMKALDAEAAALVLELPPAERRRLEVDVLADAEPWRSRMDPAAFDDLVLKSLPQKLIERAHGLPLVDAVADLKREAAAG